METRIKLKYLDIRDRERNFQSQRVHNIVEYIKSTDNFLCDADELEERGIQNILQEDFDIYETFTKEELEELKDDFQVMALENEVREANHLFSMLNPYDEGEDLLQSEPENIYGKRTIYKVLYSYPVDENIRKLLKISYPLKPATQSEMKYLATCNKLVTEQVKTEKKIRQRIEPAILNRI